MIVFDPYFVMYPSLVKLVGGVPVMIDTYPDFRVDCRPRGRRDHRPHQGDPLQQPRATRPA